MPAINSRTGGVVHTICFRKSANDLFCFTSRSHVVVSGWISEVHSSMRLNKWIHFAYPSCNISRSYPENSAISAYLLIRTGPAHFALCDYRHTEK